MIDQARKRKLYDRLAVAELLSFLSEQPDGNADLVTAADVFVYLGQLDDIFVQSLRTLRPGGWLAFSIELLADTGKDYALRTSGRYAHAPSYISRLCEQTGYTVSYCREVTLRKEAGVPMPGLIYILGAR
jgi:predicted TPR repeat methyltransferase